MYSIDEMLRFAKAARTVQLDQLEDLLAGNTDPDNYNPNALREIVAKFGWVPEVKTAALAMLDGVPD